MKPLFMKNWIIDLKYNKINNILNIKCHYHYWDLHKYNITGAIHNIVAYG